MKTNAFGSVQYDFISIIFCVSHATSQGVQLSSCLNRNFVWTLLLKLMLVSEKFIYPVCLSAKIDFTLTRSLLKILCKLVGFASTSCFWCGKFFSNYLINLNAFKIFKGLYADYLFEAITSNWERKRPAWVMLMVNSLTEADIRTRGMPVLDLHLARQAAVLGKSVGAVEKVEEQCNPLNSLNTTQVYATRKGYF